MEDYRTNFKCSAHRLTYHPLGGERIEETAANMVFVAKSGVGQVDAEFNGIKIVATIEDTPGMVVERWNTERRAVLAEAEEAARRKQEHLEETERELLATAGSASLVLRNCDSRGNQALGRDLDLKIRRYKDVR